MSEFKPPAYNPAHPYQWNYDHPPPPPGPEPATPPACWRDSGCTYAGLPAASPLAVAAGPLLNGAWALHYAALGFDVLTYKTVRTARRPCYEPPNLAPVACEMLAESGREVPASPVMRGSWAVSFGMPSQAPAVWRRDLQALRAALPAKKLLAVSIVGQTPANEAVEALAEDYARCGGWAAECGADLIEANFSCPNVTSCDAQLYQQPDRAGLVARRIRDSLPPETPLLLKIGLLRETDAMARLIDAVAPHVQALVAVNAISATVRGGDGRLLFDGAPRGVCGQAIRAAAIAQVAELRSLIERRRIPLRVIGVGGVSSIEHVRQFLEAGAEAVQLATAAMLQPEIAWELKRDSRALPGVP